MNDGEGDGDAQAAPPRVTQDENNFSRLAPTFELNNEAWELFIHRFRNLAYRYQISDVHFKTVLYSSLSKDAFALACPNYSPHAERYRDITGIEYAQVLQNLFEPQAESQACRQEFLGRSQQIGERPERYFRDKTRMFQRAYRDGLRDWSYFYQEAISGLINEELKYRLRGYRPSQPDNPNEFLEELTHWANVQRTRYAAGEINQADVLGCEVQVTGISYRNYGNYRHGNHKTEIKREILAVTEESESQINAFKGNSSQRKPSSSACWHCGEYGHLIADCARKLSGLPKAVSADNQVAPLQSGQQRGRSVHQTRPTIYHANKPKTRSVKSRSRPPLRRFNKRVAQVWEDQEGITHVEELTEDEEAEEAEQEDNTPEQPAVEQISQGINMIDLQHSSDTSYAESAFIPGAFLGL